MSVTTILWVAPVLVVGVILILVAGRRDADGAELRTPARYVGAACLLATFLTLFGAFGVVSQLSKFVISNDARDFSSSFSSSSGADFGDFSGGGRERDDALWRGAVQFGLLTAASAAVLVFHRRRRTELLATPSAPDGLVGRVDRTYLYVACFVAVFLVLFAAYAAVYGIFRAVAPGVTAFHGGSGERERGIAQAISLGALALGAAAVFLWHWRDTPRRLVPPPAAPAGPATVA
jgi:hypothetical protein